LESYFYGHGEKACSLLLVAEAQPKGWVFFSLYLYLFFLTFFCEELRMSKQPAKVLGMATKTKPSTTAKVATSDLTATTEETLVVITPKAQKAVKALAQAHLLEKEIDANIKSAREIVLSELDFGVTVIGTDARGKRLVKVRFDNPTSPKYDAKAMLDFITKNHPEMLATFLLPPSKVSPKVLTL
jgi:hypothetical protein